jgi:hypothetical protein
MTWNIASAAHLPAWSLVFSYIVTLAIFAGEVIHNHILSHPSFSR